MEPLVPRRFARTLKVLFTLVYLAVVVGGAMASVLLLDPTDWPIVKAALSSKMLTYGIAVIGTMLAEILFSWRFKIHMVEVFNGIEADPRAAAGVIGCLIIGNCILAAAVFG